MTLSKGDLAAKTYRHLYKVIDGIGRDRPVYFPSSCSDGQSLIKEGDICILLDSFGLMGHVIYTLGKFDKDNEGNLEKVYVADFYEDEAQVTKEIEQVDIEWLENERSTLLISDFSAKVEELLNKLCVLMNQKQSEQSLVAEDLKLYLPKQPPADFVITTSNKEYVTTYSGAPKGSKLQNGLKLLEPSEILKDVGVVDDCILLLSIKQQDGQFERIDVPAPSLGEDDE